MKLQRFLCSLALMLLSSMVLAESVTYRIKQYNNTLDDFEIQAFGQVPIGSEVWFENKFGATIGNRFNQIPRNNYASMHLYGFDGCTIQSVTLTMCSNNKAGSASLSVLSGETELYFMRTYDFCEAEWAGRWVSKDLNVYVSITKQMQQLIPVADDDEVQVIIKGGTSEGSVYLQSITIDYAPGKIPTQSALGWSYEKLEKKSTLNDGDVLMLYRSGNAAGDIDGMETSHYLDAVGVASTSDVKESNILFFTANKTSDSHWTLTDQYGRKLGAGKVQNLTWDEGEQRWDISLGYDGATIASANTKCGTLRFNAPSGGYPRFWNYTSTSLPLPYAYRRVKQNTPIVSNRLDLSENERVVNMSEQDTVVIKYTLTPATTTDFRVKWESSNPEVATVQDGIVTLIGEGSTVILAKAMDGGSKASCTLKIVNEADAIIPVTTNSSQHLIYNMNGVPATKRDKILIRQGRIYMP